MSIKHLTIMKTAVSFSVLVYNTVKYTSVVMVAIFIAFCLEA
jgi:hypothetical protein